MDGVRHQIELLFAAIERLELHRMLTAEDASHLQLSLANTTAIVRSIVSRQSSRVLPMRLQPAACDVDCCQAPSSTTLFSERQLVEEESSFFDGAFFVGEGSKTGKEGRKQSCEKDGEASQKCSETILSVATLHGISVDEIRVHNPQLSKYADEDVLPPNTYIKMRLHSIRQTFNGTSSKVSTDYCIEGAPPKLDDTMPAESPLPLAPLPDMQDPRCRTVCAGLATVRREGPTRRDILFNKSADGSPPSPLMQLPSPSPNRFCQLQKGDDDNQSIEQRKLFDNHDLVHMDLVPNTTISAMPTTAFSYIREVSSNIQRTNSFAKLKKTSLADISNATLSAMDQHTVSKTSAYAQGHKKDAIFSTQVNFQWAGPTSHSFISESSSYHSTRIITPNVSLSPNFQTAQMKFTNGQSEILGSLGPPPPPPPSTSSIFSDIKEASCHAAEGQVVEGFEECSELSSINKERALESFEDDDGFDTLNSISLQYNVTIKEMLQWNPYLITYGADDPLPANFPILLPLQ